MPQFLLAAIDFQNVVWLCVIVISFISWVMKQIKGVSPPPDAPRQRPPKPKAETGRSEIEVLLEQLMGEKPKPQSKDAPKPAKQQGPSDRNRNKSKSAQNRSGASVGSRPMTRATENPLGPSNVGADARTHHLGNRVEALVQRDIAGAVRQDIDLAVQQDMGSRIAAPSAASENSLHPLVKVLRDPIGVRQAILLNEILQRPKVLRR